MVEDFVVNIGEDIMKWWMMKVDVEQVWDFQYLFFYVFRWEKIETVLIFLLNSGLLLSVDFVVQHNLL